MPRMMHRREQRDGRRQRLRPSCCPPKPERPPVTNCANLCQWTVPEDTDRCQLTCTGLGFMSVSGDRAICLMRADPPTLIEFRLRPDHPWRTLSSTVSSGGLLMREEPSAG